ncbi:uncharacterized protein LOC108091323 [Drosophila ficusphila]|uniref:uncharacterized protein LOC108091323 n=1 Tax=Drosophila ficusphila TaxID=30025 RepID=UPI0007E7C27A|nr:uncharacterized protein LOC108091323 [Drosophila ficusphila]
MPFKKPLNNQKPLVGPLNYQELQELDAMYPIKMDIPPNLKINIDLCDVELQLQAEMGELQRIFDHLAPPPTAGRDLVAKATNNRGERNRSNPIFFDFDETPLPLAHASRGQRKRTRTRNPILNPYDSEPEVEENPQVAVKVVEEPALAVPNQQMDAKNNLLAVKFCNLMLARLWRRRKAEVYDLHALVRKYQDHAARTQTELFTRNRMILMEQRRGDHAQLRRTFSRLQEAMDSCANMDSELKELRLREAALHSDLAAKTQECEYFAEMLDTCRSEMFRELTIHREGASELAKQQRRALDLERQNAQLEDDLLTIKDQFLSQNDEMSVVLGEKQQQLDTAYEMLKSYEEELAGLELKYKEQLRQKAIDVELQNEIMILKRNLGVARYLIFYLTAREWGTFHGCVYHLVAGTLDCLSPAFCAPPMANNMLRVAVAAVFLLFTMY